MRTQDDHVEETTEEVRQGENVKGMTTVLGVSLTSAAVILALVLLAFAGWTAGLFG